MSITLRFTLCVLYAERVASEPSGPPGLAAGPQQLTGSPPMGSGLFCGECSDCNLRDRRLEMGDEKKGGQ